MYSYVFRRKSSEQRNRQTEVKYLTSEKAKKEKTHSKIRKSPTKTKRQSPSTSYEDRQRRESPDERSRMRKKSLSPDDARRKGALGKGKKSLSPANRISFTCAKRKIMNSATLHILYRTRIANNTGKWKLSTWSCTLNSRCRLVIFSNTLRPDQVLDVPSPKNTTH